MANFVYLVCSMIMANFVYLEESLAPCSPWQYRGKDDSICYNCTEKCSTLNKLTEEQRQICTLICAESTTLFTTVVGTLNTTLSVIKEKNPSTIQWLIPVLAIVIIILVVSAILLFRHLKKQGQRIRNLQLDNGDSSWYKEREKRIAQSKTANGEPALNEEREPSVADRDSLANEEQERLLEPPITDEHVHIPDNEPPNNPENNSDNPGNVAVVEHTPLETGDPFESIHGPEDSEEESSSFQPIEEGNVEFDVETEEIESAPVISTGIGNLNELRKTNKSS